LRCSLQATSRNFKQYVRACAIAKPWTHPFKN